MSKLGKLKPEFKAKWLAALRSGEYKQGTAFLYNKSQKGYCCLGVACVVNKHTLWSRSYYTHKGKQRWIRKYLGLPKMNDARTWWEVLPQNSNDIDSPQVMWNGNLRRLSELNDEFDVTFTQIADLIEAQL